MAVKNRFSESHLIVPMYLAATNSYNGGGTFDSINMSKYNHCTLIIYGDAAVAGDGVLTLYAAAAAAGTTATAGFTYRYGSAVTGSAGADVLGTASTVAAAATLTITGASLASAILVIEFEAADLCISGVQYKWATPTLDATGSAGMCSAIAILSEPRYSEAVMDTAIT